MDSPSSGGYSVSLRSQIFMQITRPKKPRDSAGAILIYSIVVVRFRG